MAFLCLTIDVRRDAVLLYNYEFFQSKKIMLFAYFAAREKDVRGATVPRRSVYHPRYAYTCIVRSRFETFELRYL